MIQAWMRYVEILGYVQVAFSLSIQAAMIALQIAAFRRHHHVSFALLAIASACGIAYLLVVVAPPVLHTGVATTAILYAVGLLLLFTQGVLGLVGIVSLFRAYRQLAERAAHIT